MTMTSHTAIASRVRLNGLWIGAGPATCRYRTGWRQQIMPLRNRRAALGSFTWTRHATVGAWICCIRSRRGTSAEMGIPSSVLRRGRNADCSGKLEALRCLETPSIVPGSESLLFGSAPSVRTKLADVHRSAAQRRPLSAPYRDAARRPTGETGASRRRPGHSRTLGTRHGNNQVLKHPTGIASGWGKVF